MLSLVANTSGLFVHVFDLSHLDGIVLGADDDDDDDDDGKLDMVGKIEAAALGLRECDLLG